MRRAFDSQRRLDCKVVFDVQLNLNCRDEIVPVLKALQHIYGQPALRDQILALIAGDVNAKCSKERGREGMQYWQILVLVAVRLGCGLDYDKLQDLAEQHRALRQIMGIGDWDEQTIFDWRRIRDNVCLVRPETIKRINQLIVDAGIQLVPEAPERVRVDSFVAETNIHYPTEGSLIRDGLRKILSLCAALSFALRVRGWRQHKHLNRKAKTLAREIDRIAARKGPRYQERLQTKYRELLELASTIMSRAKKLQERARDSQDDQVAALEHELATFLDRTEQVCSTARRRVLQGETVPNSEKLFSIFEPHTQLYKRGKAGQPLQFGRLVLVCENAAGFISHYYIVPRDQQDRDVVVEQTRLAQEASGGRIQSASFDRGFHSPNIQEELAKIIAHPCLPKPGAKQAKQQQEQADIRFHQARQHHPGIESAIGALQAGNGLKRCYDRSEAGFERYIGLGVLGRNLHVLGKILIAQEDVSCKAAYSRREPIAA